MTKEFMVARRGVTRGEVLSVSASLFAANGYRSTSLGLVSARLGVTRQALYYHFTSKEEILGALFTQLMDALEEGVATAPHRPTEPRFLTLMRAHIATTLANTDLMALLLHERPEIAKVNGLNAAKRRRRYSELFIEAYENGVAEGSLLPMDPWVAVNTTIASINGVSSWFHGEAAEGEPGTDIRERLESLLSRGFLIRND